MSSKHRAEPLAPEERRRSIVEAVIPLLLERGSRVTTAEMAGAAGIAEGTIFRVFPDKSSLVFEACKSSFDPEPELAELASITQEMSLEVKLRKAAEIILNRAERVHALAGVLRSMPHDDHTAHKRMHEVATKANSQIFHGLSGLFEGEAETLGVEPARAAAAFRGLLYAVSFPFNDPSESLTTEEAVEVLLDGIRNKDAV